MDGCGKIAAVIHPGGTKVSLFFRCSAIHIEKNVRIGGGYEPKYGNCLFLKDKIRKKWLGD